MQSASEGGKSRTGKVALTGQRARETMERFNCGGWLYIVLPEDSPNSALLALKHACHTPYTNIAIPDEIKWFLESNKDKTPAAVSGINRRCELWVLTTLSCGGMSSTRTQRLIWWRARSTIGIVPHVHCCGDWMTIPLCPREWS